jgi:predicted cupin superfamily sugar epimerase
MTATAAEVIARLDLRPHPEGGHFRETFRDAVEIWHYYAGDALTLRIADAQGERTIALGPDLAAGETPQAVVPPHAWQAAATTGDWTLVGCTVAPGFDFATFELAPKDWAPAR